MSEILVRATRAICQRAFPPRSTACCGECGGLQEQAKAVILSLREPTDEMLAVVYGNHGETSGSDRAAKNTWQTMIDAALK